MQKHLGTRADTLLDAVEQLLLHWPQLALLQPRDLEHDIIVPHNAPVRALPWVALEITQGGQILKDGAETIAPQVALVAQVRPNDSSLSCRLYRTYSISPVIISRPTGTGTIETERLMRMRGLVTPEEPLPSSTFH